MSEELTIRIRAAKALDVDFIMHSWLKSFREGGFMNKGCPHRSYYYFHHKVLEHLLSSCDILVACSEEQPEVILGWCCVQKTTEALVVHYIYVKRSFRGHGIARRLYNFITQEMQPGIVIATHMTPQGRGIGEKVSAFYNPYQLFIDLPKNWNH